MEWVKCCEPVLEGCVWTASPPRVSCSLLAKNTPITTRWYHTQLCTRHRIHGMQSNFKVVGTVKVLDPCKNLSAPFNVAAPPPCISSQAVILTKFRLTTAVHWKFQQVKDWNTAAHDLAFTCITIFPAWEHVPTEKTALWGLGTPSCRNGGPGNGVPTHFNPSVYYSRHLSISFHLQQTLHSQPSLEANKEAFNVNDSRSLKEQILPDVQFLAADILTLLS